MGIIESHQLGLIEQLAEEARGLAGRPGDTIQRVQVYHHLYQHSGGRHTFALLCAEAALALDARLASLDAAARRRRWRTRGANRATLIERCRHFADAVRDIDRQRCEAMLMAYRLAITPGLGAAALERLPEALVGAMRAGEPRQSFLIHQAWIEAQFGIEIEAAIVALEWPLGASVVAAVLAALRIPVDRFDRAERRGWARFERQLIDSKPLPRGFAGNPGQHYYRLQRNLADKRRRERDRWDDLPAVDSVSLAA